MKSKSKSEKRELTKQELEEIKQEAAQRYTDTSWKIFLQNRKNATLPSLKENTNTEESHTKSDTNQSPVTNGISGPKQVTVEITEYDVRRPAPLVEIESTQEYDSSSCDIYEKVRNANEPRRVVQIERVAVTYEPLERYDGDVDMN
ncbi:unnamed protein product [Acanthoscelides obtectus]|nr:unnamed protein product [Acanthoscelides obtectus]CAK1647017.1 hypothetical protein AOBTE_LOCUS15003 [Acanthoscelides obtectus]